MKVLYCFFSSIFIMGIAFAADGEDEFRERYSREIFEYARYGVQNTNEAISVSNIYETFCGKGDDMMVQKNGTVCKKCEDCSKWEPKIKKCPRCLKYAQGKKKVAKKKSAAHTAKRKTATTMTPKVTKDVIVKRYYVQKEIEQPKCDKCTREVNININTVNNITQKEQKSLDDLRWE